MGWQASRSGEYSGSLADINCSEPLNLRLLCLEAKQPAFYTNRFHGLTDMRGTKLLGIRTKVPLFASED